MPIYLTDSFTDADGTLLSAHTSESGHAWALISSWHGSQVPVQIVSNAARATIAGNPATNTAVYRSSVVPPSADYTVDADFTCTTVPNDWVGVAARLDPSITGMAGYAFMFAGTQARLWRFSPTTTGFGATISFTPVAGVTYRVRLRSAGTSHSGFIQRLSDGQWLTSTGAWQATEVACTTATEATHSIVGRPGIVLRGNTTDTGVSVDNMSVSGDVAEASEIVAAPSTVPANHPGSISIMLSGANTSWDGATTFSVSGVAGVALESQEVLSPTSATLVISTGSVTGALTLSDGTSSVVVTVATPGLSISPASGVQSASQSITLTGTNTLWAQETATPLFLVSGGGSPSLGSIAVNSNTSATALLSNGSSTGALSVTDASTGATATFTVTSSGSAVVVPVTDQHIFFSPYNWYSDGAGSLQANNVKQGSSFAWCNMRGGYIKTRVTVGGSGSIKLNLNTASLSGISAAAAPTIAWSINGGEVQTQLLAYSTAPVQVTLASGLIAGTYDVFVWFRSVSITQQGDYWSAPSSRVQVSSLELSSGATAAPAVRPNRLLVLGDSITEGDLNMSATRGPNSQDALQTYGWYLAQALNAEVGIVGFYGQSWGWLDSTWHSYASGKSRLQSGMLSPQPDYIVINYGENNGNPGPDSSAVSTTLTAIAAAAPAPSVLFLNIPFSGKARTNLTAATRPANCLLIDTSQAEMLPGRRVWSYDGQHPTAQGHANLGAILAREVFARIGGSPSSGIMRTVSVSLVDETGVPAANLSSLRWAFFDQQPGIFAAPVSQGGAEVTDGSGQMVIDVETSLPSGGVGWLIVTNSDGDPETAHRAFSGPVAVV